jgi:hypothetical protein
VVITCGEWITTNKLATTNRFLPNFLDFLDTSTLRTAEAMALWCSLKRTGKSRTAFAISKKSKNKSFYFVLQILDLQQELPKRQSFIAT